MARIVKAVEANSTDAPPLTHVPRTKRGVISYAARDIGERLDAKALGLVDELGNMYDALEGTAELAGIKGKPEIKEYGKISPWSMLLGASESVDIKQLLFHQLKNDLPVVAPMALPEKWQVE